jgi:DNA-binding protein HU-beta
MNRKEVVSSIAQRSGLSAASVDTVLTELDQVLLEAVGRGEKVQLPGLLTVERVERSARTGRNPRTGEQIDIPAGHGVKVTAGSRLKDAAGR